jgi:hypothetical protein
MAPHGIVGAPFAHPASRLENPQVVSAEWVPVFAVSLPAIGEIGSSRVVATVSVLPDADGFQMGCRADE